MDWIKQHYDRVLLAVLGLLLIVFAGLIITNAISFGEIFLAKDSRKPADNKVPEPKTEFVRQQIAALSQPAEWTPGDGSLFISKPYVLKDGKLINPLKGGEPLHPPVPNEWLEKYNLDYAAGDILDQDPDQDKFSNLEEWLAKTDPTAPGSKPGFITKLRLVEFVQEPFRLKFSGTPDNGTTFSINTLDLKQPTQFLKLGEMVRNTPFKVISHEAKTQDKNGLQLNVSELTVENQETGEKIVLIYDTVVNSPTAFADFKYLWDGSAFRVKKNDSFSVEPDKSIKYKLIDISNTGAVIQRIDTGEKHDVPPEKR